MAVSVPNIITFSMFMVFKQLYYVLSIAYMYDSLQPRVAYIYGAPSHFTTECPEQI